MPNATGLFTVLYGIYPCNFTAFLRDAGAYLREKKWPGALGDGVIDVSSSLVRSRSEVRPSSLVAFTVSTETEVSPLQPIIRIHTLHPDLFGGDPDKELTDTKRWARLEAADVRAQCDRNVAHAGGEPSYEWRDSATAAAGEPEADEPQPLSARSAGFEPVEEGVPLDSTSPTPKARSLGPSRSASRAVSRVRSATPSSTTGIASPVRVSTPLMPATTHFTNFQALQSSANSPTSGMSPARRSGSRFRVASNSDSVPEWPGTLELSGMHPPGGAGPAPSSMSRRSSGVASHGTGIGLLSPELVPVGSTRGVSPSPTMAHIVKLERDVLLLKGEVDFQNYLKQLHLQHMGTLHREKVLESGAEAERQSSVRRLASPPLLGWPPLTLHHAVPHDPHPACAAARDPERTRSAPVRASGDQGQLDGAHRRPARQAVGAARTAHAVGPRREDAQGRGGGLEGPVREEGQGAQRGGLGVRPLLVRLVKATVADSGATLMQVL